MNKTDQASISGGQVQQTVNQLFPWNIAWLLCNCGLTVSCTFGYDDDEDDIDAFIIVLAQLALSLITTCKYL